MTIKTINNKEAIKLDATDKKIFYHLSQNIRHPRKELAKKLNISQEKLNYRIERLLSTIIEPITLINFPLMDIKSYVFFIKEQLDKKTIIQIEKAPETYLFTQCIGGYHHILHIITNDLENFMKTNLPNITIKEIYEIKKYTPDNYNGFKVEAKPNPTKSDKKIQLKKNHLIILKELIKNPLATPFKISIQTKIDRRQIKKIIEELEKNNYIQKFRFILNSYKTGFETYILKIHFNYGEKEAIIKNFQSNIYSGFIYESSGFLYMWYLPISHEELFDFVNKIEQKFPNIKINTIQPTDLYTLNFMPKQTINFLEDKIKNPA